MSDLVVNVRQISNYPPLAFSAGSENLLLQQGGLGGPYASISAQALVQTALNDSSIGIGQPVPTDALQGGTFATNLSVPSDGSVFWNAYFAGPGIDRFWRSGVAAGFTFADSVGFFWNNYGAGQAGQQLPVATRPQMVLDLAGALRLTFGTLTVARDPAASFEVATMGWVGNNTVASFNNRKGQVQLNAADVYQALCLCDPIATQPWVIQAIQAGIQNLLMTCPFVTRWNGRTGSVYLMLSDITTVFFQPGQQPVTPTPPLDSNDLSIANTQWVVAFIENELAGSGGTIATQSWVLANTVNSFNGRKGVVTLTGADVFDVGAASLNSPNFSGIPTAPTAAQGQATGQIATTAFVQQAISHNTAGVSTFNTRTGDVVLTAGDVTTAGGLTNPSPNLTGAPTAPTATVGTSSPQIANTQFVMNAISTGTVQSFNTRTGAVSLLLSDVTGVGGAPTANPNFTGTPTAPTAAPGTDTNQLATTAFVTDAFAAAGGVTSFNSRTGAVILTANDISAAGGLVNPSVGLTGAPTAPTATPGTNTAQIATTAFVQAAIGTSVASFNGRTGAVTLTAADVTGVGGALLASPNFTGSPTAPTAAPNTNTTQLATTAFVTAAIAANPGGVISFNARTGAVVLSTADITAAGGAPAASPSLTGTPLAPTATPGTSTTQIATTAFVQAAVSSGGVTSFNGRTGAVTFQANDISAVGGALLAGPAFTGAPTAPTAVPGTSTTVLATTQFVTAAIAANPGITVSATAPATPSTGQGWLDTTKMQLFVWTGLQWVIAVNPPLPDLSSYATQAYVQGNFVPLAGATMTGRLAFGTVANLTTPAQAQPGPWVSELVLNASPSLIVPDLCFNCFTQGGAGGRITVQTGGAAALAWVPAQNTISMAVYNSANAGALVGAVANSFNLSASQGVFGGQGIAFNGVANMGFAYPYALGYDTGVSNAWGVSFAVNGSAQGWLMRSFGVGGAWNQLTTIAANPSLSSVTMNSFGSNTISWSVTSCDARLKHNLSAPSLDALDVVNGIPVLECDWVPAHGEEFKEHWDFTLTAQDVNAKLPYAYIKPPDEHGYATLHPLHLISVLWKAVQLLTDRVQMLEAA